MKKFLVALFVLFALTTSAWLYLFFYLPPKNAESLIWSNVIYFLLLLSLSLAAGSSLVLYSASFIFGRAKGDPLTKSQRPKLLLQKSLRRGVEIGFLASVLLILRLLGIFNIVNAVLIILVVALVEGYFSSSKV